MRAVYTVPSCVPGYAFSFFRLIYCGTYVLVPVNAESVALLISDADYPMGITPP
jgi:hypothetical protein